jgi:hypothetical protein
MDIRKNTSERRVRRIAAALLAIVATAAPVAADSAKDAVQRFFSASTLEDITFRRLDSASFGPGVTIDMRGDGLASFYSGEDAIRYGYGSMTGAYVDPRRGLSIVGDLSGKANFATTSFDMGGVTATDTGYRLASDMVLVGLKWKSVEVSLGLLRDRNQLLHYKDVSIITQMLDETTFSTLPGDSIKPVFRMNYMKAIDGLIGMADGALERAGVGIDLLKAPALLGHRRSGDAKEGAPDASKRSGALVVSGTLYDTEAIGKRGVPKVAFDATMGDPDHVALRISGSADAWVDFKKAADANLGLARMDASLETRGYMGYFANGTVEAFQRSFIEGKPEPFSTSDLSYGYRVEAGFFTAPPFPVLCRFKVGYGVNDFDLVSVSPLLLDAANFYFSLSLGAHFGG